MRTEQNTPRLSRRTAGIIAGVAGGALLLGGTTYALWTDNAVQTGGTITNGNLDVAALDAPTYYDVSQDRSDATDTTPVTELAAHSIPDLTAYTIVPGDVLESNFGFVVALEGDNLVGELNLSLAGGTAAGAGVTFTAQAFYLDGGVWTPVSAAVPVTPGGATDFSIGFLQAANEDDGALDGALPVIDVTDTAGITDPNITVVVTATFAAATTNRDLVQATSALGNVTVTLDQVRAGAGNFP